MEPNLPVRVERPATLTLTYVGVREFLRKPLTPPPTQARAPAPTSTARTNEHRYRSQQSHRRQHARDARPALERQFDDLVKHLMKEDALEALA